MRWKKPSKSATPPSAKRKNFTSGTERKINQLFYIILPLMIGVSILFSFLNANRANEIADQLVSANHQLLIINKQQKKDLDATRRDTADLKTTLLCIGQFFNLPNRTSLKIESYSPCVIRDTSTGVDMPVDLIGASTPAESSSATSQTSPSSVPISSTQPTAVEPTPQPNTSQPPVPTPAPRPNIVQMIVNFLGGLL